MPITLQEISNRALAFSREWKHAESEDADAAISLDTPWLQLCRYAELLFGPRKRLAIACIFIQ